VDSTLWQRVGDLFAATRELQGEERLKFLSEQCADDEQLRQEVEALLEADAHSGPLDLTVTVSTVPLSKIIANRFRVVRYIAEGGMGTVYEALDLQLGERVALKTIRPDIATNRSAVQRFKQEISLGKTVTHPNVCRIHDLVIDRADDGTEVLYLSMQYLEGETLAARIARGRMHPAEALPLLCDMADGLAAAHQAGVIHRDFKSGNVILVKRGDREHAVITDFGLARASEAAPVSRTGIVGTVEYMAPEQIRGEKLTGATDIYALGVVAYEMVTGQRPFAGESKLTIALKHLTDEPRPPRDLAPSLDKAWNEAILRCLEKRPEERFQSAEEVKACLSPSRELRLLKPHRATRRRSRRSLALLLATPLLALAISLFALWARTKAVPRQPNEEPPRIAVLPFESLATASEHDYLADGLADEIAGLLSHVRTLQVIAPVSVQRFKNTDRPLSEISRQLHARYFVTGSIEHDASDVRIRVRMLDASTGILWARTYDRNANSNLTVENEVAQDVVQSLAVALKGEEKQALSTPVTENSEAFEAYLRGKSLLRAFNNRGQEVDFTEAEEAMRKAIQFDPQMAAAYGELAHLYFLHDVERARPTTKPDRVRVAAEQALTIDPKQIAALDALAMMYVANGRNDTAYQHSVQVLALNPHDPGALMVLGAVYGYEGLLAEALLAFRKAGEAEPLYLYPFTNAAEILVMLGRSDEAWQENEAAAAIEPDNYSVLLKRAWISYHQGRLDEAERLTRAARSYLAPTDLLQAWVYSRRGAHAASQALLRSVERKPPAHNSYDLQLWLAEGWALENNPGKSLSYLERVAKVHPNEPWFARDINFNALHGNPEFVQLLSDMRVRRDENRLKFHASSTFFTSPQPAAVVSSVDNRPAAATYKTDSLMPSSPSSRSIRLSAMAAVQNGARLRAVAVKQNVWQK